MNIHSLGRSAACWLLTVCLCCAFLSLSCVFLYVGGPEKDTSSPTPKREFVEATIVGTWRWIPFEEAAGSPDYFYSFHPNGDVYGSSQAIEDSTAEAASYELSLERSYCRPGFLAYQLKVDGDFRFTYELTEITKDTLRMADCSSYDAPPMELTFVRVPFDESEFLPTE